MENVDSAALVTKEGIVALTQSRKDQGMRLMTLTAVVRDEESIEVLYHFGRDLELEHHRLTVSKGDTIPSISGVFFAALLVENEIQDQFGVRFEGLVLDYHRTLLFDPDLKEVPFSNKVKLVSRS